MNETLTDKQCPNCNSYLYYIEYDTEIPYEGKITIKHIHAKHAIIKTYQYRGMKGKNPRSCY
ncbi:hypothetical protein [Acidiplasma cupricumulans]|uniref:hypothetical protein n=1 Tax=Acidiplasma cupricumulans TaxID=312540 RepID=UPI0007834406|nr:hypothetical protein [Acidiplasma cupricumulans]